MQGHLTNLNHKYDMKYTVAIYEIDRAYGGPEEGGWWYDTGTFERILCATNDREHARRVCKRANDLIWSLINERNRSISSVCYAGGSFEAGVYEGLPPRAYPERRPYYE